MTRRHNSIRTRSAAKGEYRPHCYRSRTRHAIAKQSTGTLCLFLLFLVSLSDSQTHALAQEQLDTTDWKRGFHGFVMLCRSSNIDVESDLRVWARNSPDRTVLIILGSTRSLPINVVDYVNRGGAVLLASDQGDDGSFRPWGIGFRDGPQRAVRSSDMFRHRGDCPVVKQFDRSHPLTKGLHSLISNRPGGIDIRSPFVTSQIRNRQTIANMPTLLIQRRGVLRRQSGPAFVMTIEGDEGGRAVLVGDQSIFTNQMLVWGDNARFALRTIAWLRGGTRDRALILINRQVANPLHPTEIELRLPPPRPSDVRAALKSLPPEVLLDFGNSVVAAVEDEGVMNELITRAFNRFPSKLYQRILILLSTTVLLVVAFFRISGGPAEARSRSTNTQSTRVQKQVLRKRAAEELLNQFLIESTGSSATAWPALISGILIENDRRRTRAMRREIARSVKLVSHRSPRFWTTNRLEKLESQVASWIQLYRTQAMTCELSSKT